MEYNNWDEVRSHRTDLLYDSDWTDLPHASLTDDQKTAWINYRELLKNIPQTYQNIEDIIWPTKPGKE